MRDALLALCLLPTIALTGCTAPLRGPEADLLTFATPTPTPEPPPALLLPAPVAPGTWKAWIPTQVTADGDRTPGYWMELSPSPPTVEAQEPAKPLPRVPKTTPAKPATATPALAAPIPPGRSGMGGQP